MLRERKAIDQEYGAKLKKLAGNINSGADGLSLLPFDGSMILKAFNDLFLLEYSNHTLNKLFPLNLQHIGKQQEIDKEL